MKWSLFALCIGFCIDLLIGDPHGLPHPVAAIGHLISLLERLFRRLFPKTPGGERAAGACIWILTALIAAALPALLLWGCARVSVWLRLAVESVMCGQILAAKSLRDESMKVYAALKHGSLDEARQAVSMIVGRDVARLDARGVMRAAVETGLVPARMDDVFNFIPARLSALLMLAAGALLQLDVKNGWKIFRRDRCKHASPNSAQTESVCAGLLGLRLAGDAWYHGVLHKKDYIGDAKREIELEDIPRAGRLMYLTAVLALVVFGVGKALLIVL